MPNIYRVLADFDTQLVNGVDPGDTTATLYSATDDDGVALPTGIYAFTIDMSSSEKEYFVATLTGTALTAIQNISRQGALITGFARKHRSGSRVMVTDWALLFSLAAGLNGGASYAVVQLVDGATIATNALSGNVFDVTLGGNRTFSNPTGLADGQIIEYRIKQDATGNRTATWGSLFSWTTDVALPSLSTAAGKIDHILFQYKLAENKLFALAVNKGAN